MRNPDNADLLMLAAVIVAVVAILAAYFMTR